ncbi:hypothetical protein Tco_1270597 [Tanacetum coccineum]
MTTPEHSSQKSGNIVTKPSSVDEESTAGHNKYCLSEEEISRRRRLRRQFFGHTSDDEEDDEEEGEEKKEQEWTLERIKDYYDRGIHDHSDCEDAEEQRQLQSGFYYKVNVKCNEDMLEQRPPSPPPPPPLVLWKIMLNMPSYIERRKRDPSVSFWSNISSSSKDSFEALIEEKL